MSHQEPPCLTNACMLNNCGADEGSKTRNITHEEEVLNEQILSTTKTAKNTYPIQEDDTFAISNNAYNSFSCPKGMNCEKTTRLDE